MMISILLITALSLFLEANLSLFIPINTHLFNNFFTVVALIIISKLIDEKIKFYLFAIIVGCIYDILFTNRIGFSILIFFIIAIIIKNINRIIKGDIYIIKSLIVFIFYRLSSYLVLLLIGYEKFDIYILFKSIYSSVILNLIYIFVLKIIFLKDSK